MNDSRIVQRQEKPNPGPATDSSDRLSALLIRLMFAARRLVEGQTRRYGFSQAACAECQANGFPGVIAHYPGCKTGAVDQLLADILNLYTTEVDAAQTSSKTPPAASEFGEPWIIDTECPGQLLSQHGVEVYDGYGTELPKPEEEDYAARIAACVNACAGISTEALLRKARSTGSLFTQQPDETCTRCHRQTDLCVCRALGWIEPFEYPEAGGAK